MKEHNRVVVHIHDPALRIRGLGYLVNVWRCRKARSYIKELADAHFCRKVVDSSSQKLSVLPGRCIRVGKSRQRPIRNLTIGREVIFTSQ
ncbi:hypothetical protein Vau01_113610 [Virgisporangium aurantiacum]|uniref:Uncharacterized protein n=1 Tax=Virgisporangium aurantiacum TaxID=175570 RepID=A0A8J3ZLZ1_9ACTN|nr:hypothetical protein Vau01_113610 [Virgisporangium aurantiacum]